MTIFACSFIEMNLSGSISRIFHCCFQPIETNLSSNVKTVICWNGIRFSQIINGNSKRTNASCRTLYQCMRIKFSLCSSPTWCYEVGLSTNIYHVTQLLHFRNNKLNIPISYHLKFNKNYTYKIMYEPEYAFMDPNQ